MAGHRTRVWREPGPLTCSRAPRAKVSLLLTSGPALDRALIHYTPLNLYSFLLHQFPRPLTSNMVQSPATGDSLTVTDNRTGP